MHITLKPDRPEAPAGSGLPFDVRAGSKAPASLMDFDEILNQRIINQGDLVPVRADAAPVENKPVRTDDPQKNVDIAARGMHDDTVVESKKDTEKSAGIKKDRETTEQAAVREEKRETKSNDTAENEKVRKETVIEAGARCEIKKSTSTTETDLAGLLSVLSARLTAISDKYPLSAESKDLLRGLKNSIDEISGQVKETSDRKDLIRLKHLMDRVTALLDKIDHGRRHAGPDRGMPLNGQLFSDLESLAAKIKKISMKTGKTGSENTADTSIKGEVRAYADAGTYQRPGIGKKDFNDSGNQSQQGNQGMNFSLLRQGKGTDSAVPGSAVPLKNPLFDEQLGRLLQQAQVVVKDGRNGSFTLRLYPESLGKVTINLGLEQGTLSGRFLVDTTEVKQALMEQLHSVREHLSEAGIAVGDFQVNVRGGGERNVFGERREHVPLYGLQEKAGESFEYVAARYHDGTIDVII